MKNLIVTDNLFMAFVYRLNHRLVQSLLHSMVGK